MKLIKSNLLPQSSFFNGFFDDDRLWNPDLEGWFNAVPAVNIKEDDDAFKLELAAPGMNKKDFKIDIENGMLMISSEKSQETEKEEDNFTRREFSYRGFNRSFRLPDFILEDKIKAEYKDGLLRLSLPKNKKVKLDNKKEILVG